MADAPNPTDDPPTQGAAVCIPSDSDLIRRFESLGGAGHGSEFGRFQTRHGHNALGLLGWADLATGLLIRALEDRFERVGEAANTIIFQPGNSEEWWTRDSRYWMAMRTLKKIEAADSSEAAPAILARLRSLREALITDLTAGEKLFVFRDIVHDIDDAAVNRLHAAIRAYGPATLFILRYEDVRHPAGMVEAVMPGLLIGYVANFSFSRDNRFLGPIDDALLPLCRRAWALHTGQTSEPAPLPVAAGTPIRRTRPAARHIVFVGNCQIEAMVGMYRRFIAPRTRDHIEYVPSYETLGTDRAAILEQADLIVEQVMDLSPNTETAGLASGTPRIQVPLVTGAFLWPFRAQSHPKARSYPFMQVGAFDAESSDSYLNRMIIAGTDPEEAVDTYINLDVGNVVNLDRLYELMVDRQRARDTATGYDIAGIIERHFKSEYLFLTPYHPNRRVALALADELFRRLDAETDDIDRMHARTRISPFPEGETPIHPAVCRHWGLNYIAPDQRYRYRNEGTFTFREYALRYMRYEWNPDLEEGLWLSHQRRHAEAVAPLRSGVAISPQSARGANALGEALLRSGDAEGGLLELRRAITIEASNGSYHAGLGSALRDAGRLAEAEAALRQATIADPTEPHFEILLAHALRQQGKLADAAAAFARALALDPWAAKLWQELAGVREALRDFPGAQQALRRALEIDDTDLTVHKHLAELLGRHDRHEDAVAAARVVTDHHPDSAAARLLLAEALRRQGQTVAALTETFSVALAYPQDGEAYHILGCLLQDAGDLLAAEQAFRRAIDRTPENAHYRHQLSVLRLRRGHLDDAIDAAEEAVTREPLNPHRFGYLADLLANAKAFDRARAALAAALALMPGHTPFRIMTSDLFARDGRLEEALEAAQAITRDHPDDALALGHLAHVEQLLGRRQDAELHLRAALAIAPDSTHLQRQWARLTEQTAA